MRKIGLVGLGLAVLLSSNSARADEPDPEAAATAVAAPGPTYALGARVGGYGFRGTPESGEASDWSACRMKGLGVFGTRTLGRHFFVEAGFDAYFSDEDRAQTSGWKLDRVSGLTTLAGGARFFPEARVSPYLQLGAGLELTRVRVLEGAALDDSFALPFGFFGLGADLRLGRAHLGAVFRISAMGFFDPAKGDTELSPRTDVAAQGQFYALVDL